MERETEHLDTGGDWRIAGLSRVEFSEQCLEIARYVYAHPDPGWRFIDAELIADMEERLKEDREAERLEQEAAR